MLKLWQILSLSSSFLPNVKEVDVNPYILHSFLILCQSLFTIRICPLNPQKSDETITTRCMHFKKWMWVVVLTAPHKAIFLSPFHSGSVADIEIYHSPSYAPNLNWLTENWQFFLTNNNHWVLHIFHLKINQKLLQLLIHLLLNIYIGHVFCTLNILVLLIFLYPMRSFFLVKVCHLWLWHQ